MKISVFLPCRAGSERVPDKNMKPFAGMEGGLVKLKLSQLSRVHQIHKIYLSTNDSQVIEMAQSMGIANLVVHRREESLATSQTSTDLLVGHANSLIEEEHILWTHVTSPFFDEFSLSRAIDMYFEARCSGYDSLMTVKKIHGFLWADGKPFNYDRSIEKWPRTQTIKPVYEVDSAAFIAPKSTYDELGDRIGRRPYLLESTELESFDIDWPSQFALAERLYADKIGAK
ncbi:hypothetical protein [uncultured Sphaerotilus sp.]|uniref:acylneuraminate cytidylyltransferase family protein n=1 Tax=uncultured Sphaerotilus sp. TaxID=474984 RepID=UPI0030CA19FF